MVELMVAKKVFHLVESMVDSTADSMAVWKVVKMAAKSADY